jgi:hypothetical protein
MKNKIKKRIKFWKQYENSIISDGAKKELEKQYKILNRKKRGK